MRVDKDIIQHFGDQKFYNGFISQQEFKDHIEMTFLTASIEGFARWYMMFGDMAEILSPDAIKHTAKKIATAISKKMN